MRMLAGAIVVLAASICFSAAVVSESMRAASKVGNMGPGPYLVALILAVIGLGMLAAANSDPRQPPPFGD